MSKIPKSIHHIWIGNNPLSNTGVLCIESAKIHNSTYEFNMISRYDDIVLPPYIKKALEYKKWAFVSDYIRFYYLEKFGGIYLDTDTYVLKSFDPLIENDFFAGYERKNEFVYCGIIGARKNSPIVKSVLEFYDNYNGSEWLTSPQVLTMVLGHGDFSGEKLSLFESGVFYPVYSEEDYTILDLHYSYTTHLWDESWVRFSKLRKFLRRHGLMRVLKRFKNLWS